MKIEKAIENLKEVKAGDKKRQGNLWYIWVICPDCNIGRWVKENPAKQITFTGRCKACYHKVANTHLW